jgi:hypothetical protein
MNIEQQLDLLEKQGMYYTDRRLYESALYYYGSIILNSYNYRKKSGKNIKYFGVVFSSSGSGKDFSLDTCRSLFNFESYISRMNYCTTVNNEMMDKPEDVAKMLTGLPSSVEVALEGTKEGLFTIANSQANSGYGSLNLISREIGDIIAGSTELISKLKELYDGHYKAKVIKGNSDSSRETDIDNIVCNMFAAGSQAGFNAEGKAELQKMVSSGMYRRSYIIDMKPNDIVENEEDISLEPVKKWYQDLQAEEDAMFKHKFDIGGHTLFDLEMTIEHDAEVRLKEIGSELIAKANEDKYSELIRAEIGSKTMIEDLSYIIAFLERKNVSVECVNKAYMFYQFTRKTVTDIFKTVQPYHTAYDLLKRGKGLSKSEMIELDDNIPNGVNKFNDMVPMLQELCYRKNELLVLPAERVMVPRYNIEPLPLTTLDSMIVSTASGKSEGQYEIAYFQDNVPFFGANRKSIEYMVRSPIESFLLCHFNDTDKSKKIGIEIDPEGQQVCGYRSEKYFISGANMVAFDIDDGLELTRAKSLLENYTYIIYTTRSHQKDKNGFVCDRFRIIMPTKQTYYLEPSQYKEFYINLESRLGLDANDIQTRNVSRLWFTNKDAEVFVNEGELLDTSSALPDTEKTEAILPMLETVNSWLGQGEIDIRLEGIYKHFITQTSKGGRNGQMFKLGKMIKDLGLDHKEHICRVNAMLYEPLGDHELELLYKSVAR